LGLGRSKHGLPIQLAPVIGVQIAGFGSKTPGPQLTMIPDGGLPNGGGWLKQRAPEAWAVTKGAIIATRVVILRKCMVIGGKNEVSRQSDWGEIDADK